MPFFSEPLDGVALGAGSFSAKRFELDRIDPGGLTIQLFDDFRVAGRPFGPHPHAGPANRNMANQFQHWKRGSARGAGRAQ